MGKKTLKAKAERDPKRNVPSRLHDIKGAPTGGSARQIAVNTLKRIAHRLKIPADLKTLRFDKVKKTVLGEHVLFQQCHNGKPISGAWIRIDIDREGKVYNVLNDLVPQPQIDKAKRSEVTRATAGPAKAMKVADVQAMAMTYAGGADAGARILSEELVYFPVDTVPVKSWKIVVHTDSPLREW